MAYLAGHPIVSGNHVELLVDGERAYTEMLRAIAAAERQIVLESYIFADDATGRRFVQALAERARKGVRVYVLVDGVGSLGSTGELFAPLRAAGGEVAIFRPLLPFRSWRRLWKRDHRKILTVDGRVAFIGGLNIADAYAPVAWGGGGWHDVHAKVSGPVAQDLTRLVGRTWNRVTKRALPEEPRPVAMGATEIQLFESRRRTVRKAYLEAMRSATRTIRITNAYCIPDGAVQRAMRQALRRGVRVQLLLAGKSDLPAITYASRALYSRLLRWGVEIHEWTERVLHAKTAVIDGEWCTVGSYNLDRRSLMHNLEANVTWVDAQLGAALDAQFERDVARSQRIDPVTWHRRRPLEKLAEVFFYALRYLL